MALRHQPSEGDVVPGFKRGNGGKHAFVFRNDMTGAAPYVVWQVLQIPRRGIAKRRNAEQRSRLVLRPRPAAPATCSTATDVASRTPD